MIDDVFVIDATVHNYNVHDDNIQANRWANPLARLRAGAPAPQKLVSCEFRRGFSSAARKVLNQT